MAPILTAVLGMIETVTQGSNGLDLGVSDLGTRDLDLNLRSNDLKRSHFGLPRLFSLESNHLKLSSTHDLDPGAGDLDLSSPSIMESQQHLVTPSSILAPSTLPPECISVDPANKFLRELCGFIDDGRGAKGN